MSYQVLARKWRPHRFSEMVGQEHVLRALINALDSERIHHAFLFTGTRGVGKTTVARIFAKCLNCETGVTSNPCGKCDACVSIDEGRFVDLIEVDAASRTKVDDTRELLENVQYAPTRGRYKVYLIDEVHMLSNHSFNALLKTLEEPPPHVKFLLATTDPQKLPVTVLSRCLQFNLKRLSRELIHDHLNTILKAEKIEFESPATLLVATAADGSIRDALSLLDQAIAYGSGEVREADVRMMLGTINSTSVEELLRALAAKDAEELMNLVAKLDESAPDYGKVLDEVITLLQRIALCQLAPKAVESDQNHEAVVGLAESLSPEDTQLFYQIALIGRRDLPLSPSPRGGFEMVMLRMLAFTPEDSGAVQVVQKVAPKSKPAQVKTVTSGKPSAKTGGRWNDELNWPDIVQSLGLKGVLKQFADNCVMQGRNGNTIEFNLDPLGQPLMTDQTKPRLAKALSDYFGEDLKISVNLADAAVDTVFRQNNSAEKKRLEAARRAMEEDPQVKALQEQFGAKLDPDSIKPMN